MSLYKGTQLIAGAGGGSEEDNLSITKNASDKIQTIGVIDQNDSSLAIKIWTGTQAEYDAIVTKDPETEYIITDDIGGSATVIAELAEAVNDKVDKGHQVIEFQVPTADNGYTWYRKYADGWVEQGGVGTSHQYNTTSINATFPIEMQDVNYQVLVSAGESTQQSWDFGVRVGVRHTTGLDVRGGTNSNSAYTGPFFWQVSGMAA